MGIVSPLKGCSFFGLTKSILRIPNNPKKGTTMETIGTESPFKGVGFRVYGLRVFGFRV